MGVSVLEGFFDSSLIMVVQVRSHLQPTRAFTLTAYTDCVTRWAYGVVEETESCRSMGSGMDHQAKGEQPKTFVQLFFS